MRALLGLFFLLAVAFHVLLVPVSAQQNTGSVSGVVLDSSNATLAGAQVEIRQKAVVASTVSDSQGGFAFWNVAPGSYTLAVSYVGFSPFETSVTVTSGQTTPVNAMLQVASESESVIVTARRAHGEAEAINEEKTADNILNVLPAEVITSLPNANIADAVGRLPGVTLERDEGEGKYVQIRGTEPRLANLTIDGVEVPSPEGGVRQVKLDAVPADLIESVQVYKTLEADQNGDAIGGSVNLVTRKAGDRPILSIYGLGGFTPIIDTRGVYQAAATMGKRFGRLGVMVSGDFDYNYRGIDDIEPGGPPPASLTATSETTFQEVLFPSTVFREYLYDRRRWGIGTSLDYKLSENSSLYSHILYSDFKDYGDRMEWVMGNPGGAPAFDTEIRNPEFQIASGSVGGYHVFGSTVLNWQFAAARSSMQNPIGGGESHILFNFIGTPGNCQFNAAATTDPFLLQFTPACFADAFNPSKFQLSQVQDSAHGETAQINLEGTISVAKNYHLGSHPSTLSVGFYLRNAHKFDDSYEIDYCPVNPNTMPLMTQFLRGIRNNDYYNGNYPLGPMASWETANAFRQDHPGLFTFCANQTAPIGGNSNNFDLVERVSAGYVMDSIDFSRYRLVFGVRFEGTQDSTISFDTNKNTLSAKGEGSYVDVLPSAALRIRLDRHDNSALRIAYARGLSRPDPAFLTTATSIDNSTTPPTLTVGNPSLRPEHANNIDVLFERYLHPLGAFQAGFFYKNITDPIVLLQSRIPNFILTQAANSGNAYIAGFEASFTQHFTYLPGALKGLGLFANYSYATSQANNVNPTAPGGPRTDSPALLRQAPNTFNISPTYDRGRLSVRVGMVYNDANIFAYFFTPFQKLTTPSGGSLVIRTPGGITGPFGDTYLFAHFQVDAQGSYYLGKGFTAIVSGLNLNNAVFGFFEGSEHFWNQREYYKPTFSFGFRWDMRRE